MYSDGDRTVGSESVVQTGRTTCYKICKMNGAPVPLLPVPTVCPLTSLSNDFTTGDVNANDIGESVLFPQTSLSRNAPSVSVPNMTYHIYFRGMNEQIKVLNQK